VTVLERHLSREGLSKEAPKWAKEAHHFRFIVSPERGSDLDLEAYIMSLLETMESDLKTTRQWYATCHYNTDNPHAHVVIMGVDERGKVLLLARDYFSHGVRHLAEREATVRVESLWGVVREWNGRGEKIELKG
jgi:type IV secretory pathway VirD2 relaxase